MASVKPVYIKPNNKYEQFVNKVWERDHLGNSKENIVKKANQMWPEMKQSPDKLDLFLSTPCIIPRH